MDNSRLKKRSLSQEDLFNLSELFKLMKPRVMSLVIFTCAVGLLTAPNLVSTKDAIVGILLVTLGAGAAGALRCCSLSGGVGGIEKCRKFDFFGFFCALGRAFWDCWLCHHAAAETA